MYNYVNVMYYVISWELYKLIVTIKQFVFEPGETALVEQL